jgi:predicted  nucleic acid-binding Zn-ribbon protein
MTTFQEKIHAEEKAKSNLDDALKALADAERRLLEIQSAPRKRINDERLKALRQRMTKIESDMKNAENRYNRANDLRIRMETKSWDLEFNQIIRDLEP